MNLVEKIKATTNHAKTEKLDQIIALSDKFNSVRPDETIWDEDRLLSNIKTARTIKSNPMFIIAE